MLKLFIKRTFRFLGASFQDHSDMLTVFFLEKAARQGDGWSQNNLAAYYLRGRYVPLDIEKAIDLYLMAAKNLVCEAYLNLGQLYYDGLHIKRDDNESAKWFSYAAECGDPRGEYRLGLMYLDGSGVKKDLKTALLLLAEAQKKGIPIDTSLLEAVQAELNTDSNQK